MNSSRKEICMRSGFARAVHAVGVITLTGLAAIPIHTTPALSRGLVEEPCEHAFVLTTDFYTVGYYSTIEIPPPRNAIVSIEPVSTDAVAYYDVDEDLIFVVNRYLADNIQIVENDPVFSTIGQYSVGNGSNPHDIRLKDHTKAYVSRYEWKTLLICDPSTGDSLGSIDLSPFADADGIPEMDRMEIVGDRLFVTLNSINRTTWLPDGPGKIAVIDVNADTLVDCDPDSTGVQPITLNLENPYSELRYDPCDGLLYVGCLGRWGTKDGGIEAIDPVGLVSTGVLMTEQDLGGDVSDVVLAPGAKGYAVVLEAVPWPDNFARLVKFDEVTQMVTDTLFRQTSGSGSSLAGIELNRQGELYLCDRDLTQPGVRIFDTVTDVQLAFVDVGLPPFDVAFTQLPMAALDSVDEDPGDADPISVQTHPNPFALSTSITYTLAGTEYASVRLAIYDAAGRRVRTLSRGQVSPGTHRVDWDGKDRLDRTVPSGVYFCLLESRGRTTGRKILVMR
jgi:hypothetical protein